MTSVVLDASALMALLRAEPGAELVAASLADSIISTVNYSEVLKKTIERGGAAEPVAAFIRSLSVAIIAFDESQAAASAALYPQTKEHGLSFADRACLALGVERRASVLTTERKMGLLRLPITVKVIRNAR